MQVYSHEQYVSGTKYQRTVLFQEIACIGSGDYPSGMTFIKIVLYYTTTSNVVARAVES